MKEKDQDGTGSGSGAVLVARSRSETVGIYCLVNTTGRSEVKMPAIRVCAFISVCTGCVCVCCAYICAHGHLCTHMAASKVGQMFSSITLHDSPWKLGLEATIFVYAGEPVPVILWCPSTYEIITSLSLKD